MSKKGNPTQVITITRSGDTVFANVTDVYAREVNGMTGAARCHPNDTFDFYEGARIALARAFGKEPFQVENKTADLETGRWVKAEIRKTGKVGDKVLITDPWLSGGKYKAGDVFQICKVDGEYGCWVDISENKANHSKHSETRAKTYLDIREYSIWTPDSAPTSSSKKEKSEPEPMEPSFQIGDIVMTGGFPFAAECQNTTGCVKNVRVEDDGIAYDVRVRRKDGTYRTQYCHQYRNEPAPLTLLWRGEK